MTRSRTLSTRMLLALPAVVLGVTAAAIGIIVTPGIRDLYQLPKLFVLTYGAAGALLVYATFAPADWHKRLPRLFAWSLVAVAACIGIGVWIAPTQTGGGLSLAAQTDAYRWLAGLVVALVAALSVTTPGRRRIALGGLTVGGVYVALVGIGQHHGIEALLPADEKLWVGINRPGSAFGNRNMAAQWMLVTLPAAVAAIAMAWRDLQRGKRGLAIVTVVAAVAALATQGYYLRLTVTRAAWAGLGAGAVAGVGAWLVGTRRRARSAATTGPMRNGWLFALAAVAMAGVAAAVLAGALQAPTYDSGHGDEKRQASLRELVATGFDFKRTDWRRRQVMWAATVDAVAKQPWGHGAGNWRVLYPRHVPQRVANPHFSVDTQPTRAHQDLLQLASEYGVQGLVAVLAWLALCIGLGIGAIAAGAPSAIVPAGIGAIVALLVDSLFSFPLQLPAPLFGLCLWAGLIAAAARPSDDDPVHGEKSEAPPAPGAGQWLLVIAAVLSLGLVHVQNGRLLQGDRLLTDANKALGKGDPGRADKLMQEAVALHANNFENHFMLGLAKLRQGDAPAAVAATEDALRWYPTLLNAWVNLAMFNANAGRDDAMNAAIDETLRLKPDAHHVLNLRADWHNSRGEHAQVVQTLWPHRDNPTLNGEWTGRANMRMHHMLAQALEKTGRWADAAATWDVMIARYPMWDYTSGSKAKSAYWQRKARKQERTRRVLTTRFSRSAGDAWTRAGDHCKALPNYHRVAESAGTHAASDKRRYAVALLHCGSWPKARHELMVALRAAPQLKAFYIAQVWHRRMSEPRGFPVGELDALVNTMLRWEPIEALNRYDRLREERLKAAQPIASPPASL